MWQSQTWTISQFCQGIHPAILMPQELESSLLVILDAFPKYRPTDCLGRRTEKFWDLKWANSLCTAIVSDVFSICICVHTHIPSPVKLESKGPKQHLFLGSYVLCLFSLIFNYMFHICVWKVCSTKICSMLKRNEQEFGYSADYY